MPFDPIDPRAQIKLVAVDMDGTFLDEHGLIPDAAWSLIERLQEREIAFVPASGRQYAKLSGQFARLEHPLTFIAENGSLVMRGGTEISSEPIDEALVAEVLTLLESTEPALLDAVVRCAANTANIQDPSAEFAAAIAPYYASTQLVPTVAEPSDPSLKLAIHAPGRSAAVAALLEPVSHKIQVVISGENWVDLMNLGVHKGLAVQNLQRSMGIGAQHTVVFGDYLNDLQMLRSADYSFAMANAHPEIRTAARFRAPKNSEHGVLQVLEQWLDASATLNNFAG